MSRKIVWENRAGTWNAGQIPDSDTPGFERFISDFESAEQVADRLSWSDHEIHSQDNMTDEVRETINSAVQASPEPSTATSRTHRYGSDVIDALKYTERQALVIYLNTHDGWSITDFIDTMMASLKISGSHARGTLTGLVRKGMVIENDNKVNLTNLGKTITYILINDPVFQNLDRQKEFSKRHLSFMVLQKREADLSYESGVALNAESDDSIDISDRELEEARVTLEGLGDMWDESSDTDVAEDVVELVTLTARFSRSSRPITAHFVTPTGGICLVRLDDEYVLGFTESIEYIKPSGQKAIYEPVTFLMSEGHDKWVHGMSLLIRRNRKVYRA